MNPSLLSNCRLGVEYEEEGKYMGYHRIRHDEGGRGDKGEKVQNESGHRRMRLREGRCKVRGKPKPQKGTESEGRNRINHDWS